MDDASNPFAPLTPAELAEAARQNEQSNSERSAPPTCPPADAEPGALAAARLSGRKPDGLWRYATAQDETAFYAARWNEADGKKTFRPITWGERAGWQFEAWPDHRPLFNLPDLVSNPSAPVVICEGEKAAEAAAAIFPSSIATTSSGGAGAAAKTDWTPLAGRSILIWPDHDAAGEKYAREVATILTALDCSVAIIDAKALAAIDPAGGAREPRDKWDAADALAEWPDPAALRKRAAGLRKAFDPGPAFVSYGTYEMGPDGLHVEVEKGRGEAKTKASEWVAAPFEILGACRDPHGRSWGKYLRWRDGDGRAHVQHVTDAALQGDPSTLCASLASDGLRINRAQQRAFANYLSGVRVMGRVTIILRTGWHEVGGQSVFVLPGATIGPRGSETVILDGAAHGPYEARGSLKDWQAGVGTLASGHVLPILAISAGLAGPLLHLAGQEGGGLHFHGQSSRGKTTLLQAAASVWGRGGSPGYVRAWRATANGLEGAAASATDTVLILDEFGQVDGREAGAVLYSLSNGGGKVRAARDGGMREPKSWRVMVLSTGEITIDSKLTEDRARKPRAGQLVRMLDIPADRGFGVFDHAGPDDDAGKLAKAFKQAAISAYGVAGPEFVRRLINGQVTGDDVRGQVGEFVSAHVPASADGQVDRAAQRLGLIATAGELATLLGVTPWREGEAAAAATWALEQWISQRGGTEPAEARLAVEQVRRFIEAHGDYRFEQLDNGEARAVPNRAGWRKGEGLEREWLIPSETWRGEICAGLDPKLVARTLWQAGILRRASDGFQQVRTIDGASKRVFVIGAAIFDGGGHEG
jgi:putative DNA primase/helicase